MKISYFNTLRLYAPLGILLVIVLIVMTLVSRHRELIPLAAETTISTPAPDNAAGLHPSQQASPAPSTPQPPRPVTHRHLRMRVTAYCPCNECCGALAAGITASGHKIAPGERFVAAPPEMPFGTSIRVPGYNGRSTVKVLDRGRAIQDDHLDVFFSSHKTALKWGVRHLTVTIQTPRPASARP